MSILDHFRFQGRNGSHFCLVSQVAGPSIAQLSDCPGQVAGYRRLRGDMARVFARQATQAVGSLHAAGVVHGDLTASNILLKFADIDSWSEEEIYERLGPPVKDEVLVVDSSVKSAVAARSSALRYLMEPASFSLD